DPIVGVVEPESRGVLIRDEPPPGPPRRREIGAAPVGAGAGAGEGQKSEEDLTGVEDHALAGAWRVIASVRELDLQEPPARTVRRLAELLAPVVERGGAEKRGDDVAGGLRVGRPPSARERELRAEPSSSHRLV